MNYNWLPIPEENKADWINLCPPNEFRIVDPYSLPCNLPPRLIDKCEGSFVIASGTIGSDYIYGMANLYRYDTKDKAYDQQPFGYVIVGQDVMASGCMIQHGDWNGRTIYIPDSINDYSIKGFQSICSSILPNTISGSILDLDPNNSNLIAFKILHDFMAKYKF